MVGGGSGLCRPTCTGVASDAIAVPGWPATMQPVTKGSRLLPYAALPTSGGFRPGQTRFPLVAVVEANGTVDTGLLNAARPVRVKFVPHPLLVSELVSVGWSCDPPGSVLRLRPSPRDVHDPRLLPLKGLVVTGAAADDLFAGLLVGARRRRVPVVAGSPVPLTMTVSAGRLTCPDSFTIGFEALERLVTLPGLLVTGDRSWFELERLMRTALRLVPAPGNPALVRSRFSGVLDAVEDAGAAFSRLERMHLEVPVSVEDAVVDIASMVAAYPAGRPGLFPLQDRLVSVLLASESGVVLAPPPGSGKTVVAVAALAELRAGRVLVAAPSAVLGQWVDEFARWAPGLRVLRASSAEDLGKRLRRCDALVASHQVAARFLASSQVKLDVLVVDEAHALLRRSVTAQALFEAGGRCQRRWALTGSPGETASGGGVGRLVEWARGLPVGSVLAKDPQSLVPIVAGAFAGGDVPGSVPELRVEMFPIEPSDADTTFIAGLCADRLPPKGLARNRMLERVRVGLGDRCAVEPSSGSSGELSGKLSAVVGLVVDHVSAAGSVLLFGSSLRSLSTVVDELVARGVPTRILPGADERLGRARTLAAFDSLDLRVLAVPPSSQRGVNLQRADLLVHLDLPQSMAEFDQRNGRAVRLASPHSTVRAVVPFLAGTLEARWVEGFLAGRDPSSLLAGLFDVPSR